MFSKAPFTRACPRSGTVSGGVWGVRLSSWCWLAGEAALGPASLPPARSQQVPMVPLGRVHPEAGGLRCEELGQVQGGWGNSDGGEAMEGGEDP